MCEAGEAALHNIYRKAEMRALLDQIVAQQHSTQQAALPVDSRQSQDACLSEGEPRGLPTELGSSSWGGESAHHTGVTGACTLHDNMHADTGGEAMWDRRNGPRTALFGRPSTADETRPNSWSESAFRTSDTVPGWHTTSAHSSHASHHEYAPRSTIEAARYSLHHYTPSSVPSTVASTPSWTASDRITTTTSHARSTASLGSIGDSHAPHTLVHRRAALPPWHVEHITNDKSSSNSYTADDHARSRYSENRYEAAYSLERVVKSCVSSEGKQRDTRNLRARLASLKWELRSESRWDYVPSPMKHLVAEVRALERELDRKEERIEQ